ncbi:MAG: accessory Sec system protein Asp2, partial [Sarcina sp.]
MQNERSYESNVNIKYILDKELSSNKLLIIFSGYSIHPIIKAPYNYRETLKNIKTNKLFISDSYGYDERGCWYLGENGNDLVEKSVISLITFISFKLNIKKKNIILLGSSKGGFASIYYGLKYKFNNILAGAPQILLGDYLSDKENILNSLVNKQKTLKQDAIIGLNSKIMDLNSEKNSKIFIWCGNKD